MAKKRRQKMTQERFNRAQPRELKIIRLRTKKPIEVITQKVSARPSLLKKTASQKALSRPITTQVIPRYTKNTACQAKKANARHNYFSMRKSGKGATRTNPKTDRFNSRC